MEASPHAWAWAPSREASRQSAPQEPRKESEGGRVSAQFVLPRALLSPPSKTCAGPRKGVSGDRSVSGTRTQRGSRGTVEGACVPHTCVTRVSRTRVPLVSHARTCPTHVSHTCPAQVCPIHVSHAHTCPAHVPHTRPAMCAPRTRVSHTCPAHTCPTHACVPHTCVAHVSHAHVSHARTCPTHMCRTHVPRTRGRSAFPQGPRDLQQVPVQQSHHPGQHRQPGPAGRRHSQRPSPRHVQGAAAAGDRAPRFPAGSPGPGWRARWEGQLWWEEPSHPPGLGLRAWQTGRGSGGAMGRISTTARPPADSPSGHVCTRVCGDSQARSGDAGVFGIFSILGHCCDEKRT